ncbi:nickel pincer cofactor biosynthesis protein LarC [Intestinibacter sp.]
MNKLYLECYSGISGDMTVAALLDLGADREVLKKALKSLLIDGFEIKISRVSKSGLDACDFDVILDKDNHDHDMEYLHGHSHEHQHDYIHTHENNKKYTHKHSHDHSHRNLAEILHIINHADITDNAKKIANNIFTILAKAEAKAHGVSIEDVHFHEVGAVDSIVDIVAVAVCIDNLNIDEVVVSPLYEGTGFVRCQHGVIPVPVPAVCEIARENDINLKITNYEGEFVTPTGAAIVAAIKTNGKLPEQFTIEKIGIGAGKREYEKAGILRAMIIKDSEKKTHNIYKLESNIDDCSGEVLGYVVEKLLTEGARDVHDIPVFMKKNRPAYQLNVICNEEDIQKFEQIIFEETTTIGIRKQKMEMTIVKTGLQIIETSLGKAQVKVCDLVTEKRVYPEYSSIVELCKKHNKSYQEVYNLIINEYNHNI